MKLKGNPNQVVVKRKRMNGRKRVVEWFRFDNKGIAEIDETNISPTDISKLLMRFKQIEDVDIKNLKWKELQDLYSEKIGKSPVGKKKADIIKELEEL